MAARRGEASAPAFRPFAFTGRAARRYAGPDDAPAPNAPPPAGLRRPARAKNRGGAAAMRRPCRSGPRLPRAVANAVARALCRLPRVGPRLRAPPRAPPALARPRPPRRRPYGPALRGSGPAAATRTGRGHAAPRDRRRGCARRVEPCGAGAGRFVPGFSDLEERLLLTATRLCTLCGTPAAHAPIVRGRASSRASPPHIRQRA